MADDSNEINIDEIIKKIKAEIAERKSAVPPRSRYGDDLHPAMRETRLFRFIKRLQWKIKKYPFYDIVYKTASRFKTLIPRMREQVDVQDLLKYRDQSFIQNAYRVILKREPDAQSFDHYLSKLRRAQFSKVEILGRLRYSKEGRESGVSVKGLFLRFALHTSYRIPLLGYLLRFCTGLLTLPVMASNAHEQEALNDMRQTLNDMHYAETLSALSDKVDQRVMQTAQAEIVNIKAGLLTKADSQTVEDLSEKVHTISGRIRVQELHILEEIRKLSVLLEQANRQVPGLLPNEQVGGILNEDSHLLDALYVAFEDNFRGTREAVKERVKTYMPYIDRMKASDGSAQVLDIGCGRGEWLELLQENGVSARGIDLNRIMVQQCQRLGFDVAESDAIAYLRKQPSGSLTVITAFHVVEHLRLKTLVELLDEAYRVLLPGGMLIFETPNPENIFVGACNFYMDPTHKNPIPPDTLKFLAESRGFPKVEIMRLHPLNYVSYEKDDEIKHLIYRFNMEQDYSIIAVRP